MGSVSSVNSVLSGLMGNSQSSIDLSSLLQAATGATTSGIDVTSAVNAALYADRAPERIWQAEQSGISSQLSALTTIQSDLTSLNSSLQNLNSLTGPLSATTVSSSNPSAVTATTSTGATIGTHSINVQALATAASWYSPAVANSTTALNPSTLTITSASGTSTNFTVGSGVNSLSDLANAINGSGIGVTASVITDATGARLALVGASTGASSDFTASSTDPSFGMTRASTAANATLTVDGIAISSATNTVTGAIPDVSLSLVGTTISTSPATLTVTPNTSSISQALSTFVSAYNTALSDVSSQFAFSASTGSQGVLSGDSVVRSLQSTLLGITGYSASGSSSSIKTLADVGITMNNDGSLSLDTAKLNSALANPSAVQNFFEGANLNGFAARATSQIAVFNNAGTGSISDEISNLKQQYSAFQTQISDYESGYIASQHTVLTAMYSQAEVALQELPTQMKEIQSELGNNSSGG